MAVHMPILQIASVSLAEIMQQLKLANGKNDDFFYLRLSTKSSKGISKQELKELRKKFYEQLNEELDHDQWRKVTLFNMTYFSRKEQDETAEGHMQRVLGYKNTIQQVVERLNLNGILQINSFLSKPLLDGNIFPSEDGNGVVALDHNELAEVTQVVHDTSQHDHGIVLYEDSDSSDSEYIND